MGAECPVVFHFLNVYFVFNQNTSVMKKIFTIALLCVISVAAFAQADSLRVRNLTGCTVYYQIHAANTAAPCSNSASSSIVALAAGGLVDYDANALPGSPSGGPFYIVGAKVFTATAACAPAGFILGEMCTGWPQATGMNWFNGACTFCGSGKAIYTPAPTVGGLAELTFMP